MAAGAGNPSGPAGHLPCKAEEFLPRPCGPPPLQGGGVPTTQQKFQSPEHRVSEPGTLSSKAWNTQFQSPEHPVPNAWNTQFQTPETLRALGAPTFSSKKGFPVAKEALIIHYTQRIISPPSPPCCLASRHKCLSASLQDYCRPLFRLKYKPQPEHFLLQQPP